MRLVDTSTLELKEFFDSEIPDYAILSHRWSTEEVTYEEYTAGKKDTNTKKAGYRKVVDLCRLAREGVECKRGLVFTRPSLVSLYSTHEAFPNRQVKIVKYDWAWIDTICIDKRNSAELSEAINSMYTWYKHAKVCLVFLPDVTALEPDLDDEEERLITIPGHSTFDREQFVDSAWFRRGWTLQELVAPTQIMFYDTSLRTLGMVVKLIIPPYQSSYDHYASASATQDADALHLATAEAAHMDSHTLRWVSKTNRRENCVATIMSWGAHRHTTRAEDMAYCLMGLFGVNMPLLYGEGGARAFRRLQLEIIFSNPDLSIFAFRQELSERLEARLDNCGMLANDVSQFSGCTAPVVEWQRQVTMTKTPRGLEFDIQLPRGLGGKSSRSSRVLILTLNSSGDPRVHVVFARNGLARSNNKGNGPVQYIRVGCCTSRALDSREGCNERLAWQEVWEW